MQTPNLKEEKRLWKKGYKNVVGLDEAGRGPLAGPVIAAAVIIQNTRYKIQNTEIKDSKTLNFKKRELCYKNLIKDRAIQWGVGKVSEKMIDKVNILEATKLAMKKAVKRLGVKPNFLILDGNFTIDINVGQKAITKADQKVFSCAAASIIAKVVRDREMERLHKKYPKYGFNRHKGYPTKAHYRSLKKNGCCKIHRKSFRLV